MKTTKFKKQILLKSDSELSLKLSAAASEALINSLTRDIEYQGFNSKNMYTHWSINTFKESDKVARLVVTAKVTKINEYL